MNDIRTHINLIESAFSEVADQYEHWIVLLDSTDLIDVFLTDSEATAVILQEYIDSTGYGSAYSGANATIIPLNQAPMSVQKAKFESVLSNNEAISLGDTNNPNIDALPQEHSYNLVFDPEDFR